MLISWSAPTFRSLFSRILKRLLHLFPSWGIKKRNKTINLPSSPFFQIGVSNPRDAMPAGLFVDHFLLHFPCLCELIRSSTLISDPFLLPDIPLSDFNLLLTLVIDHDYRTEIYSQRTFSIPRNLPLHLISERPWQMKRSKKNPSPFPCYFGPCAFFSIGSHFYFANSLYFMRP